MKKVNYIEFSGIRICEIYIKDLIEIVDEAVNSNLLTTIGYCNQYNMVLASENDKLRDALKNIDYNFADGTGIKYLSGKMQNGFAERFNLTDNWEILFDYFNKMSFSIKMIGSRTPTLAKAKKEISMLYPNVSIAATLNGYEELKTKEQLDDFLNIEADVVLVGLGSPLQELWMNENKNRANAKVIIAVGDLLKEIAGEKVRGPRIFRQLGLEWLFRVVSNPKLYFKRYVVGIPKFFLLIFRNEK